MKQRICAFLSLTLVLSLLSFAGCTEVPTAVTTPSTTEPPPSTQATTTAPTDVTIPTSTPTETTIPPTESPTTIPETTAPPTTIPETTAPPTTQPIVNPDEYIGSLYTRGQLYAMDNTLKGFGCGRTGNATRPGGAVSAQKSYGKYNAAFIADDEPTIYLTFDCGYEFNNLTANILDTLKEKDVNAVFFVTLSYCKSNPELVRRMIDEGHVVGNHSANHYSMPKISVDAMVHEIMALHNYVLEKFGYEMTLFRPPKGEYSVRSLSLTQSLGYKSVFWSYAYQDWNTSAQPDVQTAFQLTTSCAHNGGIFLLHAVSATNAAILGDLIDNLQSRGYSLELYT